MAHNRQKQLPHIVLNKSYVVTPTLPAWGALDHVLVEFSVFSYHDLKDLADALYKLCEMGFVGDSYPSVKHGYYDYIDDVYFDLRMPIAKYKELNPTVFD